eukprot:COSAG02_NODE_1778_length_10950_cov_7.595060_3_plen_322_part_00
MYAQASDTNGACGVPGTVVAGDNATVAGVGVELRLEFEVSEDVSATGNGAPAATLAGAPATVECAAGVAPGQSNDVLDSDVLETECPAGYGVPAAGSFTQQSADLVAGEAMAITFQRFAARTGSSIAAGFEHTCAILGTGSVACWGGHRHGATGQGVVAGSTPTPIQVELGPGRTAVSITAGHDFTCALLDNGKVSCWGAGEATGIGESVLGGPECTAMSNCHRVCNYHWGQFCGPGLIHTPTLTSDLGAPAVDLAASQLHVCAVLANGHTACWGSGYGNWGQRRSGGGRVGGKCAVWLVCQSRSNRVRALHLGPLRTFGP